MAYTLLVSGWIATEYWYTTGDFSWPWLLLGNGFSHEVWAVQWYEYTGIFGGTLWVLLSNILLYEAWRRRRDAKAWTWAGAVVLLPILVSLGIFWSYEAPDEGSVTVSVVQPNIDCYDKFAAGTEQMQERLLLSMIEEAPAGSDFIVLPETVWPYAYDERYLPQAPVVTKIREILREKSSGAMIVTGAETIVYYPPEEQTETARQNERGAFYDKFNSTLGIDTTACLPIHHKGRLVIGVESTPTWIFKALKFLVIDLGGTVGQLGVGEPGPAFVHNGVSVGTPICYEGLYGNFYGGFVREGARALLISSNDGWWGDTPGHKHLFSIARLRAVEHRRAIARSAQHRHFGIHRHARGRAAKAGLGPSRHPHRRGRTQQRTDFLHPIRRLPGTNFGAPHGTLHPLLHRLSNQEEKPSGEVTGTDIRPLTRPA